MLKLKRCCYLVCVTLLSACGGTGSAPDNAASKQSQSTPPAISSSTPTSGASAPASGSSAPTSAVGVNTVSYEASNENFRNPERGELIMHQGPGSDPGQEPQDPGALAIDGVRNYFKSEGDRLLASTARVVYIIGKWTDGSIDQSYHDRMDSDFAFAREWGIKLIPYIVYSWPKQEADGGDATLSQTLRHIAQLKPVLQKNADVIAFMYAGFIGPWGEWHDSQNGNIGPQPETKINDNSRAIIDALLDALPQNRMVTLRYVEHKQQLFDTNSLTTQEAFSGSSRARLGFNDECFMADFRPDVRKLRLARRPYLNTEGLYAPQAEMMDSGCFDFPYAVWKAVPCDDLLEEMRIIRASVINPFPYAERVVGNCQDEVKRRTGYRYRLLETQAPAEAQRSNSVTVNVKMTNDGFAALYNARKMELVLRSKTDASVVYRIPVSEDIRFSMPKPADTVTLPLNATLPSNMPAGDYQLLLNRPDASDSLKDRAAYSVRLANLNTWEENTGYNKLLTTISIK